MSGPMGLTYPIPGDTTNTWGTVLNTLLGLVENHDHTSGKGSLVPSAGLGINADVSWASFALTALKGAGFTEVTAASVASYADLVYVQSSDHNLYFRNQAGTNVQITAGNTLNVSIVGGIGGDYSSVGALLSFDDGMKRYLLQSQGSPRPWSGLGTADIDLYQKAASIANKVTLKSPNSLAGSYSLIMPTALPANDRPLQVDNAGQFSTNASGQVYLGRQIFTANGTYTPTTGCRTVRLRIVGGGGGGGGAKAAGAGVANCAGGGASGAYLEFVTTGNPVTGGAVVIGAGGTGGTGASTGGNGGNGGDSTVVINAVTITSKGGGGGNGANAGAVRSVSAGGIEQAGSTVADIRVCEPGGYGWGTDSGAVTICYGGRGGSNPLGHGGSDIAVDAAGGAINGSGTVLLTSGGGGGGAVSANGAAGLAGVTGGGGLLIIDEWH